NLGGPDSPPFNVAYHDRSKRRELPEPEAPKPEPTPDVPEPVRSPRRALTTEQESEVVAAYRKGATTGDLAREYGVSTSTITKVTREAGITTKNVGHKYGPGGLLGKLTTDCSAQVFAFDTLIEQEFYGASPEDMERASEALAELAKQARRLSRKLKEESARCTTTSPRLRTSWSTTFEGCELLPWGAVSGRCERFTRASSRSTTP